MDDAVCHLLRMGLYWLSGCFSLSFVVHWTARFKPNLNYNVSVVIRNKRRRKFLYIYIFCFCFFTVANFVLFFMDTLIYLIREKQKIKSSSLLNENDYSNKKTSQILTAYSNNFFFFGCNYTTQLAGMDLLFIHLYFSSQWLRWLSDHPGTFVNQFMWLDTWRRTRV